MTDLKGQKEGRKRKGREEKREVGGRDNREKERVDIRRREAKREGG